MCSPRSEGFGLLTSMDDKYPYKLMGVGMFVRARGWRFIEGTAGHAICGRAECHGNGVEEGVGPYS